MPVDPVWLSHRRMGTHLGAKAPGCLADASAQRMIPRPNKPAPSRFDDEPIRFPADRSASRRPDESSHRARPGQAPDLAGDALAALAQVSRRINDLARELKCLGYFDDDDRPRAA
jgi:hypothetical protein